MIANSYSRLVRNTRIKLAITTAPKRKSNSNHLPRHTPGQLMLKDRLSVDFASTEINAIQIIQQARPTSLRVYDQIPMLPSDLVRQAIVIASYLEGQSVVFVGDHDGTSLLLGLLSKQRGFPKPSHMLIVDFDERLLSAAQTLAEQYNFKDILDTRLYNVFDSVPSDLLGQYDWFYTNPPYGCRNEGEAARLFVTRGCEFVRPDLAHGCIILPDDKFRPWTRLAMLATQRFLTNSGWTISEKVNHLHQYHLDDDRELRSSSMIVTRDVPVWHEFGAMPYAGRAVKFEEIPHFYGRSVMPPYPHFIRTDGSYDYT